ncbi:MAG TPA: dTDP-4-dehydrorhamnose reductase [Dehalococcoidia bacterium]|nr:dTDP-4-dehydrorhamnose reductase [Dehalococcoidia bacterium]
MRIVLIGATGQLGADLLRNNGAHEIDAPARDRLDLARPAEAAAYLRRARPDLAINCAAFHNVPLCETEPEQAFRVNCVAVRDLALACRDIGARLVTFSSDYVFRGDRRTPYAEDDAPGPVQMYGITRLAGENAALAAAPEHAIVIRTCGLYGRSGAKSKGGNFVDKVLELARRESAFDMSCDQTVAPTSTDDLARAVLALIAHPGARPGVYHLVNEGQCTWHEFSRAIVELAGLAAEVRPVDRGGRTGDMRRPLYSVLANTRARALGIALRPWRDALADYVAAKAAPRSA